MQRKASLVPTFAAAAEAPQTPQSPRPQAQRMPPRPRRASAPGTPCKCRAGGSSFFVDAGARCSLFGGCSMKQEYRFKIILSSGLN